MRSSLTFGKTGDVPASWIWVAESTKVKKNKIFSINVLGKDLVFFRTTENKLTALDAYCPHMGAHLGDGKIEGNGIRCFFHNWKFDITGQCIDIPCLNKQPKKNIKINNYIVTEKYGLIWLWTKVTEPEFEIPYVPDLYNKKYDYSLGNQWIKKCHPNIVMINAIDEQHFNTVHKLPGHILNLEPLINNKYNIIFENTGQPPKDHWFGRFIARFYNGPITYNLSYYCGTNGTVTLGPDFLRLYLMFVLRENQQSYTIGKTIAFTKYRKGPFGYLFNRFILLITKLAGFYFAYGDTKVFQKIKFNFKNPVKKDKSVIEFIKHLEQQEKVDWVDKNLKSYVATN